VLEVVADAAVVGFVGSLVVSIAAAQTMYAIGLICWAILVLRRRAGADKTLLWPALLFSAAAVLSTVFSLSPWQSLVGLKKILLIPIIFLIGDRVRSEERARALFRLLVLLASLASIYGLFRYASGLEDRVGGIVRFYMTWSGQLVLLLCLTIPVLLWGAEGKEILFLGAAVILQTLCLAFTFTRGAYAGFLAGVLFLVCVREWRFVFLPVGAVLLALLLLPDSVISRAASSFDFQDWTVAHRFAMLRIGWHIFADHPLLGAGLINLQQLYRCYMLPTDVHVPMHLHNNFIQILATMGMIGIAAFLTFLLGILALQVRAYRRAEPGQRFRRALLLGCLAASVGFLVNGLFEYNFGDSEVLMLFYFVVGLSLALGRIVPPALQSDRIPGGGCHARGAV
jgi:O-antigen ligase